MKTAIGFLLSSFMLLAAGLAGAGILSTYTQTNTANGGDLLLLDAQTNTGQYQTRTIAISNLAGSGTFTTNFASPAALAAQSTNADNFDAPRTSIENAAWQHIHAAAYSDPSSIGELWNNLSSWATAHLVVSNNALYSDGSYTPPTGGNQALVIPATGEFRVVSTITAPANNGAVVLAFVGVSSDPTNTVPPSGINNMVGIGLSQNSGFGGGTNLVAMSWNKGTATADSTIFNSGGTVTVEICGDANYISLALIYPGHTNEFVQKVSRSSFGNVSNVCVYLTDSRALSGMSINALGARASCETISARVGEGTADTVIQTVDAGGQNIRVWVPANYDSRRPSPVWLFCHGAGWGYTFPWTGQSLSGTPGYPERPFFQSIVNAGVIVASSDLNGDNWGNQNGINSVSNLLAYVRQHFSVSGVFVGGGSMGGLTSLNYVDQHMSEVNGWIGLYPVCWLNTMTNSYWSAIEAAYPTITTAGYAAATAGYDPMLVNPRRFYRVPMIFFASPTDGVVNYNSNSAAFSTKMQGWSKINTVYPETGGHGDPSQYQAPTVIQFIQSLLPAISTNSPVTNGSLVFPTSSFPWLIGGNGAGLWGIPFTGIVGYQNIVTNTQASVTFGGITTSSPGVSGPSQFQFNSTYTFSGGTGGFQWNNQNNSTPLLNMDNSGNASLRAGNLGVAGTLTVTNLATLNGTLSTPGSGYSALPATGYTNTGNHVVYLVGVGYSSGTVYLTNTVTHAHFQLASGPAASTFILHPNEALVDTAAGLNGAIEDF